METTRRDDDPPDGEAEGRTQAPDHVRDDLTRVGESPGGGSTGAASTGSVGGGGEAGAAGGDLMLDPSGKPAVPPGEA